MMVECTSTCTAEPGDSLAVEDVADWMAGLPRAAQLSPVLREYGTQRDPVTTLGGLTAKWSENR